MFYGLSGAGVPAEPTPVLTVRCDGAFRRDKPWRAAALACPVFSIRTEHTVGVGDFESIKTLVDMCRASGMGNVRIFS